MSSHARLVVCVLLPFAAGYYLSYLFRSINAVIAGDLAAELSLGAADLGLLTSVYFLVFAAVVLPCGALIDRYGPRLIDSALLLLAAAGSLVFALAEGVRSLMLGRALIGLGVAVALMAGLKAIVLWFPPERVALANGWYIMLGALGALSATRPAEAVVQTVGWRGLFAILAASSAGVALLIILIVPDKKSAPAAGSTTKVSFLTIFRDPRFLRIAPLSALGVGTSFRCRDSGPRRGSPTLPCSIAPPSSSISLSWRPLWPRARSCSEPSPSACAERAFQQSCSSRARSPSRWRASSLFCSACPYPPICSSRSSRLPAPRPCSASPSWPGTFPGRPWAAPTPSSASSTWAAPSACSASRASSSPCGSADGGRYPAEAHQAAMAAGLGLQLIPLGAFFMPKRRLKPAAMANAVARALGFDGSPSLIVRPVYVSWAQHLELARRQRAAWAFAAAASAALAVTLAATLSMVVSRSAIPLHIEVSDHASGGTGPSRARPIRAPGPHGRMSSQQLE